METASRNAPLPGADKVRAVRVPAALVRLAEATINQHALDPSPHSLHNVDARCDAHARIRVEHPGEDDRELRRELHRALQAEHADYQARPAALRSRPRPGRPLPDTEHTGSYAADSTEPSWSHL